MRNLFRHSEPGPHGKLWRMSMNRHAYFYYDEYPGPPCVPYTLSDLECAYQRMLEQLVGSNTTIDALVIEPHVAMALWDEGTLTLEHLYLAEEHVTKPGRRIVVRLPLCGQLRTFHIVWSTYHCNYEFLVSGHPQGYERIRDFPDALTFASASAN